MIQWGPGENKDVRYVLVTAGKRNILKNGKF